MDRFTLSTQHLPEHDQFAFWREECMERMFGATVERDEPDGRHGYAGAMVVSVAEPVARLQMQIERGAAIRGTREIARLGWDDRICVVRQFGAGALYEQRGRDQLEVGEHALLVFDPTQPVTATAATGRNDTWMLPRALIEPHLPGGSGPVWLRLAGGGGINGLIRAYLVALGQHMDQLADAELAAVVDNFCRLLAIACGGVAGEQREAVRAGLLEQIKRYIDLHLADPDLTAARVAAAHRISVRRLHLLFEPTGTSFMQHVVSRRLEEVRASLISPASAGRSIADIALGWGFNSLPTFYRAFAKRYDVAPGDLRAP